MRKCKRPRTHFTTLRGNQGWYRGRGRIRVRIFIRDRLYVQRGPTAVIAVKAEAALRVELGFCPWTEYKAKLGAREHLAGGSGVCRIHQAGDVKIIKVAAYGCNRPKLLSPLRSIL